MNSISINPILRKMLLLAVLIYCKIMMAKAGAVEQNSVRNPATLSPTSQTSSQGISQPAKSETGSQSPRSTSAASRSDHLQFDDDLVAGMNRNPYDSITHFEKNDQGTTHHLYRERSSFSREIRQSIREMEFLQ